ncbi:hypothetical protein [Bacillus horti]|uniref:Uncharacterized protein n=1 Tax=Caldalkalibacillus horti TaxID=77523 RepID=A0ABT9VUT8_9BACI|nr:hypothetical protein [Bacillus horti]MDQ0164644.1 hypothetical protein [Bacillus horti]
MKNYPLPIIGICLFHLIVMISIGTFYFNISNAYLTFIGLWEISFYMIPTIGLLFGKQWGWWTTVYLYLVHLYTFVVSKYVIITQPLHGSLLVLQTVMVCFFLAILLFNSRTKIFLNMNMGFLKSLLFVVPLTVVAYIVINQLSLWIKGIIMSFYGDF